MFPTDHPAHTVPPFNVLGQAGARTPVRGRRHPGARLGRSRRRAAAGEAGRQGVGQDHQRDARPEPAHRRQHGIPVAAGGRRARWRPTADVVVADLLEALGPGRKEPWKAARAGEAAARRNGSALTMEHDRRDLARRVQRSRERHLLHARPRLADRHLAVPERHVLSRQGRRRRARLRPRPLGRLRARARRAAAATPSRCSATATSAWA